MKTVKQNNSGLVQSENAVQVGASTQWWKRFVEKVSFEPGMKYVNVMEGDSGEQVEDDR